MRVPLLLRLRWILPLFLTLSGSLVAATNNTEGTDGTNFIDELRIIFRVATCGGETSVPVAIPAELVRTHCRALNGAFGRYRKGWLANAVPVFEKLVPAELPTKIVYPFGGGDLVTALASFPSATEITTISLERAGDARSIRRIDATVLESSLLVHGANLRKLLAAAHSKTRNLNLKISGRLPAEIIFALGAMVVHGYEPLSLRYFQFAPDGTLRYLTDADIQQLETAASGPAPKVAPPGLRSKSRRRDAIFANAEITFRKLGTDSTPVKTFRHIAFNLDNAHLEADPTLLRHLEAKGRVTAITKAESYLLWGKSFSIIRDYLLEHMDWMISDSTGIPPSFARDAGFEQIVYGRFLGPFLPNQNKVHTAAFLTLWQGAVDETLTFRFGYPDNAGNSHLMITRPASR